jgi:aspartyl-tRNA(Asn)/glutamyl-tRNA(Gln) amidotransferase subunit C
VSVTLGDVRHIAALARLGLDDEQAERLVEELNTILEHMAELSRADVDSTSIHEPSAAEGMPLRPDRGPPIPQLRPPADFAPSMRDGFFLVPRLSTHEDTEDAS